MTLSNIPSSSSNNASLITRVLAGAGIGLLLISLFLSTVHQPNPAWGKLWMIRPLIVVPLAGAIGGLCNYLIFNYRVPAGINKTLPTLLSIVVFAVGLFMGFVLGLDTMLWN